MDEWPPGAEELLDLGAAAVDPGPRARALDHLGGDAARRLVGALEALDPTRPVRRVEEGVRLARALIGLRHLGPDGPADRATDSRHQRSADGPADRATDPRHQGTADGPGDRATDPRRQGTSDGPADRATDPRQGTADGPRTAVALIGVLERWLAAGPVPSGSWRWGAVLHRCGVERWADAARHLPDPLTDEVLDAWAADALHPAAAAELRAWAAGGPEELQRWIRRRFDRIGIVPVVPGEVVASLPVVPGESWLVGTAVDHRRTRWTGPGLDRVEIDGDGILCWGDPLTGAVRTAVHRTELGRWDALERCAVACWTERLPEHRALLADRLSDPALLRDVLDALARFDGGHDPDEPDEARVAAVVRARAILASTAPDPDPLAATLTELDRQWARCEPATWMLDDDAWRACFTDLPEPPVDRWWGARSDPGRPSEAAVLSAMAELARVRRLSLAAARRIRRSSEDA
jgi:hypothetical protein